MYRHSESRDLEIPFYFVNPGGEPVDIGSLPIEVWLHTERVAPVLLSVYRPSSDGEYTSRLNCKREGKCVLKTWHASKTLSPGRLRVDIVIAAPETGGHGFHICQELPIEVVEGGGCFTGPLFRRHDAADYMRRPGVHPNHIGAGRRGDVPVIYVTVPEDVTEGRDHVTQEQLKAALDAVNERISFEHADDPNDAAEGDIDEIVELYK